MTEQRIHNLSEEDMERLRNIPIADILGIKNTGRRQHVVCPFHGDTNPSMTIYPNDNSYHCFGCSCSGSGAISFVMESGCSFLEAINELKNI